MIGIPSNAQVVPENWSVNCDYSSREYTKVHLTLDLIVATPGQMKIEGVANHRLIAAGVAEIVGQNVQMLEDKREDAQ